jgi:hypothetical protein
MTANGVISALAVLDARLGGTNTPPLGDTNLGSSPERAAIIAAIDASFNFPKIPADLAKKDIVPLDNKAFEDVEFFCDMVTKTEEREEQEFINGISREIKMKMGRDKSATQTIEASFRGQDIVVVVGPRSHEHQGAYGCGKVAKNSKEFGPYAVFGKTSALKEFVHKIFFGLPKAFPNVQTENRATHVEIAKEAPVTKAKKGILARIFSCFCCCFGRGK